MGAAQALGLREPGGRLSSNLGEPSSVGRLLSGGHDTSLPPAAHSDGEYTGPVPRKPSFRMMKTQILNSGVSQPARGTHIPFQRAPVVMRAGALG